MYASSFEKMLAFNVARVKQTTDEFWVLSHPAVFTQGVSCDDKPEFNPESIPVVKSDRGGQITYHGPGQLIIYCLLDIKRIGIGPKRLVNVIEQALIDLLGGFGLHGERRGGAPGVYVADKKIAALGLRIRKGYCYHGLSFNVNADLAPFELIDPCGYKGLEVTSLIEQGVNMSMAVVSDKLCAYLSESIYSRTS
ncbi:MAG: lipoyl(octanoyl) transferase [Saprospiraceae bacterium]